MSDITALPRLVTRLYDLVHELEAAFPGRPFTPDGHLVGSLGEVLASHHYSLTLLPCSTTCHDATSTDGRLVQIKATQGRSVALRAAPEHLLVIQLQRDGRIEEIYNRPGTPAWEAAGKLQRNGQRAIALTKLRHLMQHVAPHEQLARH